VTRADFDPGEVLALNVPSDLKYTKSHEWVRVEGDVATIGITDYAQSELGDIVYVDLPNPGRSLNAADSIGSVESVKTVSDIYSPVSGEVVEANPALGAQSELVNSDPYGQGWMVKVRVSDPATVEGLMDAEGYKATLG
jgi:glycine cleavage system H protein